MLRRKAGKGNGQVKAQGHVPAALVFKAEDLLFCLPVGFAQKNLGIFQDRGVDGHKTEGTVYPGDFFH